ncbi:hypothetical protein KNU35_gp110 [Escherichia phage vB_EcoM_005]|uniref:Uncharacterized protein n=1 Tax=Escherichia phage vB_EcoM_005 TaxID=2500761 RepID=A0A3T0IM73_9CAUD|nr:hypothetical protein KNU35_gp110 [Escherichia phage vB_EcoM_005]AZV01121.1 hypothetical protein vBEcoM005_234 [Escherichia phage vB_EcoM_005]
MIILVFIELIMAIVCSVCFFLGVWTPGPVFLSFLFIGWILSTSAGLLKMIKNLRCYYGYSFTSMVKLWLM